MVATTERELTENTLTFPDPLSATKTVPFSGSKAMPSGPAWTGTLSRTLWVVPEMMDTFADPEFVTNTSSAAGSTATPNGLVPTGMTLVTEPFAAATTSTLDGEAAT